jgi:hypothetical protein
MKELAASEGKAPKQALQENLLQLPPVDMQVDPILLPLLLPS